MGEKLESAVLEIIEIKPRIFLFKPISSFYRTPPTLSLYKPQFHDLDEFVVRTVPEFRELNDCLASINYDAEYRQSDYNAQIAKFLLAAGWRSEVRILK